MFHFLFLIYSFSIFHTGAAKRRQTPYRYKPRCSAAPQGAEAGYGLPERHEHAGQVFAGVVRQNLEPVAAHTEEWVFIFSNIFSKNDLYQTNICFAND